MSENTNAARRPVPETGILLTHFIVSDDIERSARFYTDVLGGEVVREGEPTMVALANSWVIINRGGGPTEDKPTVTLEVPSGDVVSSFMKIRQCPLGYFALVGPGWRAVRRGVHS